jgi:hypothetical protein
MGGELAAVCIFTTLVIAIGQPDVPGAVFPFAAITSGVLVFLILISPFQRPARRIFDFFDRFTVFHPWTRGSRSLGLAQLGVRLVQSLVATLGTILAAYAFGLSIPVGVMMAYLPIIGLVNAMPVNVAGIGAVQGAWLLLEPWAPGEQILAFAVLWTLAAGGAIVLRGLPFVRRVTAEIREGTAAELPSDQKPGTHEDEV